MTSSAGPSPACAVSDVMSSRWPISISRHQTLPGDVVAWRKKKNGTTTNEEAKSYAGIPASAHARLEHKEQQEQFRAMLRRLPPKQKAILELRVQEQLSYEEIARMSGRSVSTIKASVFFALEKLRKFAKRSGAR